MLKLFLFASLTHIPTGEKLDWVENLSLFKFVIISHFSMDKIEFDVPFALNGQDDIRTFFIHLGHNLLTHSYH